MTRRRRRRRKTLIVFGGSGERGYFTSNKRRTYARWMILDSSFLFGWFYVATQSSCILFLSSCPQSGRLSIKFNRNEKKKKRSLSNLLVFFLSVDINKIYFNETRSAFYHEAFEAQATGLKQEFSLSTECCGGTMRDDDEMKAKNPIICRSDRRERMKKSERGREEPTEYNENRNYAPPYDSPLTKAIIAESMENENGRKTEKWKKEHMRYYNLYKLDALDFNQLSGMQPHKLCTMSICV